MERFCAIADAGQMIYGATIFSMAVLDVQMKFAAAILFFAIAATGCVSKSKADAEARAAFIAGENAAFKQMAAQQHRDVTVTGPVQNHTVPWVDGLTLAQAIATANYLDARAPEQITITREGENATVSPKVLLNGTDVPLEPGDAIDIQP